MTTESAIKKIMDVKGIRFMELAERTGVATNTLAGRIKSRNISIEKLGELMDALGYKIVLVPAEKELERREFEIE